VSKLCAAVTLSVALSLLGQESGKRFDALKQALGLSDAQVSQLQQARPAAVTRPAPAGSPVAIYPAGRFSGTPRPAANEDALRVLDDSQRGKLAAIKNILDRWDAGALTTAFGLIDEKQWPGGTLCDFYPIRTYAYAKELNLSDSQERQLEELRETARAAGAKPPHDAAQAVLDEAQRAKLASFEGELQLAGEAIELGLIPRPLRGEVLCH
jgi:hypothetical protein